MKYVIGYVIGVIYSLFNFKMAKRHSNRKINVRLQDFAMIYFSLIKEL